MKDIFQVVKTIQLSEKATLLGELNNQYVFKVDRSANKLEVKEAIETYSDRKAFYRQLLEGGILETARTRGRDAVDLELQQLLRVFTGRTPK